MRFFTELVDRGDEDRRRVARGLSVASSLGAASAPNHSSLPSGATNRSHDLNSAATIYLPSNVPFWYCLHRRE